MQKIKLLEIRGCQRVAVQSSMPSWFSRVCQHAVSVRHGMTVGHKKNNIISFDIARGGGLLIAVYQTKVAAT